MSLESRVRHRLVNAVIGGLTFAAILGYLWYRRQDLAQLVDIPASQVVVVAVLFGTGHWLNSLEFWILYRRLGAPLGATESWLLFTAGQLLNHLPGRVGTIYRLEYLRTLHATTYARSASVYGMNLVITALTSSTLGLLASLLVGASLDWRPLSLLAIFTFLLLGAILALLIPLPIAEGEGFVARTWEAFRSGWREIGSAPISACQVAGLETARYIIAAWRMQVTFSWIGMDGPWAFFLVLASVTGVVSFLALTPAALGLRELAIGAAATLLGSDFDQGLLGATIDRAVLLLVTGILGGVGILFTIRRLGIARFSGKRAGRHLR